MKNQNEQIANIQLHISKNCTETEKQIIHLYWKLLDNEFVNAPRWIKKEFHINQYELSQIIKTHTTLTYHLLCKNCLSYEKHEAKNQSHFNAVTKLQKGRYSETIKCNYCKVQNAKQLKLDQEKKHNELIRKLNNAIENKNWRHLSTFEKKLLNNSLEMNFNQLKTHYGNILGQTKYITFIRALENLEAHNLLILKRDSYNNYIINHDYLSKLSNFKNEINYIKKKPESSVEINHETNEIKFKLTVNEKQNHPDSPLYAGTVIFKEKIVIEPNVEYVFGQWKRANDHLYLTLVPTENLERLPQQKRVSKLPISIQKGVTDFLNNLGENLNF